MTTPTTRETADHAELARLAEAAAKGEWWSDDDAISHQEVSREDERFIYAFTPAVCSDLLSEIAALRGEVETLTTSGIIEVAVRNPSVADYVQHWEGRATQAERQRDELRKALEFYADRDKWSDYWTDALAAAFDRNVGSELGSDEGETARQVLANQGAE